MADTPSTCCTHQYTYSIYTYIYIYIYICIHICIYVLGMQLPKRASDTSCLNGPDRPLRHSVSDGVLHVILQNTVCLHMQFQLEEGRYGSVLSHCSLLLRVISSSSSSADMIVHFPLPSWWKHISVRKLQVGHIIPDVPKNTQNYSRSNAGGCW